MINHLNRILDTIETSELDEIDLTYEIAADLVEDALNATDDEIAAATDLATRLIRSHRRWA